jgi:hypothetical protein
VSRRLTLPDLIHLPGGARGFTSPSCAIVNCHVIGYRDKHDVRGRFTFTRPNNQCEIVKLVPLFPAVCLLHSCRLWNFNLCEWYVEILRNYRLTRATWEISLWIYWLMALQMAQKAWQIREARANGTATEGEDWIRTAFNLSCGVRILRTFNSLYYPGAILEGESRSLRWPLAATLFAISSQCMKTPDVEGLKCLGRRR